MSNTSQIRVRRRHDGQSISGKVSFLAPMGLMVRHDPTDLEKLIVCDGTTGFSLTRDVVTLDELSQQILLNTNFPEGAPPFPPIPIDGAGSASKVQEIEIEGAALIQTSGTGAISSGTAVNTGLGLTQGKWRVKQGGDELAGYLRAQLDALDPDNNAFRILIDSIPNP